MNCQERIKENVIITVTWQLIKVAAILTRNKGLNMFSEFKLQVIQLLYDCDHHILIYMK